MGEGDFVGMRDPDEVAKIAAANALESIDLNKKEIAEIVVFLNALTDPQSTKECTGDSFVCPEWSAARSISEGIQGIA